MDKTEVQALTLFLIKKNPIGWVRARRSVTHCGKLNPDCFSLYLNEYDGYRILRELVIEKFKEDNPETLMEYLLLGEDDE